MAVTSFAQSITRQIMSDEDGVAAVRQSVQKLACDAGLESLQEALNIYPAFTDFLASVGAHSPYLEALMVKHTHCLQALCENDIQAVTAQLLAGLDVDKNTLAQWSESQLMAFLRARKGQGHLYTALAELSGQLDVSQTTRLLSDLAALALQLATDWLLLDLQKSGLIALETPLTPSAGSGICVLGMGKLGAGELNYSSDIDLIIVYQPEPDALRYTGTKSAGEIMTRFARRLVKIMDERTGDGYVFRTDLRLRPDPGATPLAIPYEFALGYYESRGQNWERAAMIKAKPVAGDLTLGDSFLAELSPFIWRRYLDFAAISDIKAIKRQIHAHRGHGKVAVDGHNVKLGRGGIREIEFFVQTQQLIAGGRDPELRGKATVDMLSKLAAAGWIDKEVCAEMSDAYGVLRRVEHAIQMVNDEQTHTLPQTDEGMAIISAFLGYEDTDAFRTQLMATLKKVEKHFGELFEQEVELGSGNGNLSFTGDAPDPSTVEVLSSLGFQRPSDMWGIIKTWHSGRYRALQWEKARERLTELMPAILSEFGQTQNPDETIVRFDTLLSRLPAGMQLFSLLQSNPELLRLIAVILDASPPLANTISENPLVFDGMLDPAFLVGVPDKAELDERLNDFLSGVHNDEEKLDRLRIFANEQRFLISVRLLMSLITPQQAGIAFSDLADVAVTTAWDIAKRSVSERHGLVANARVAVVALGRLGSREMTASSDLDLIVIYDAGGEDVSSDGEKPIAASQYFARMTQRLISALSAPMTQGVLYELDFRLRPSGNKGPLATSLQAFSKYQHESAWTWEHMVLCRARTICGTPSLCEDIETEVIAILDHPEDVNKIRADIADMRLRLDREKPGRSVFDVKRMRGGTTDLDFVAQLIRMTQLPNLNLKAVSASDIFESLDGDDDLSLDEVKFLTKACDDYSAIIQMVRLCSDDGFDPERAPRGMTERIVKHFGVPDIGVLQHHLAATCDRVASLSQRVLGFSWDDREGKL